MRSYILLLNLFLIERSMLVQDSNIIEYSSEPVINSSDIVKRQQTVIKMPDVKNKLEMLDVKKGHWEFEYVSNLSTRIVGGRECFVEEYPWIVSLRTTTRLTHYCGGSLISSRWILSAAHCFENNFRYPSRVTAIIGLSSLRRTSSQAIVAKKIFIHNDYSKEALTDDIALVVLKHRVSVFLNVVGFVEIPDKPYSSDLSKHCPSDSFMVAGWGSTQAYEHDRPPYRSSPHLKCVELPFITNEVCEKYASAARNDKLICTLYAEGGKDACQGDSGGPLFCRGVQYGIVSWGHGCAAPNSPGFYTRVDKYLDFITDTVKNYRDSSEPRSKVGIYLIMIMYIRTSLFN